MSSDDSQDRLGHLEPGTMVDQYRVEGVLGAGAMGSVYRGVHPQIGKRVAIKILRSEFSHNEGMVKRFIQEAQAANQVQSPYIVDIFALGRLPDGRHYLVMELLDGEPLSDWLKRKGRSTIDEARQILDCVCHGLFDTHKQNVIHRDLKPGNIIVIRRRERLEAKILDFGIAKLFGEQKQSNLNTRTGVIMGTPAYMSPEQLCGQPVDYRTDLYALGVIMFQMFTGKLPFDAPSFINLANQHLSDPPPDPRTLEPDVPESVVAVIAACLDKSPEGRPESADVVAQVLDGMMELPPSGAQAAPVGRGMSDTLVREGEIRAVEPVATKRGAASRRWTIALGTLAVLAIVGFMVGSSLEGETQPVEFAPLRKAAPKDDPRALIPATTITPSASVSRTPRDGGAAPPTERKVMPTPKLAPTRAAKPKRVRPRPLAPAKRPGPAPSKTPGLDGAKARALSPKHRVDAGVPVVPPPPPPPAIKETPKVAPVLPKPKPKRQREHAPEQRPKGKPDDVPASF